MTPRAVYASLLHRIFGAGSATFDVIDARSNSVIGALAHPTDFLQFKSNFEERLRRLSVAIQADTMLGKEVLATVNRIVDAGWDGAYAELCALDYFLAAPETGPGKILLDRTVCAASTLASEMGMQYANHDMSFLDLGISMDTKLLSDKTGEILNGIFSDYRAAKGIKRLLIVPSYDLDDDFEQYSANRKALLKELIDGVDTAARPDTFRSAVIPGLSYAFAWNAGVYFGEGVYSPHEHAKNHHPLLFGHAKKFSRNEPSLITFVIFPWSGEKVFPFDDSKRTFFKKLGEHFFNDYLSSGEPATKFNKKFKSAMSAGDVTKYLSGVIYLEDACITASDPKQLNIDASFIWNANAAHSLANHALEAALRHRGACDLSAFK
ncbi:hypothetical protein [Tardiphaga sp. OK245]|uniref:hypothetical protein n=1 Tax=Tardiphaga sp. OK245 TaxID=1855306 RepID=UPI0008A7C5EF|nr:hypothetical protein [Tardiphaga sp. OK245]SEH40174.1 hypothetical protein SAMN05216367_0024 [Tardiphaga sp. OK245]